MNPGLTPPDVRNLEAGALARALAWARDARATGCLVIKAGGGVNRLYLEQGRPAGALLAQGFVPLAQLLVEEHFLDDAALDQALEEVYGGLPLEEAVIKTGVMTELRLQEALEVQEARHVRLLGELASGELEFTTETSPTPSVVRLSSERALLDVLECPPSASVVAAHLAALGASSARLTSAFDLAAGALKLRAEEVHAIELLRTGLSRADFEARSGLSPSRSQALLALVLELQLAEVVDLAAEAQVHRERAERERAEASFALWQREQAILRVEWPALVEVSLAQLGAQEQLLVSRELESRRHAELTQRWWQDAQAIEATLTPEPAASAWLHEQEAWSAKLAEAHLAEQARVAFVEARDTGLERERRREVRRWRASVAAAEAQLELELGEALTAKEELRARWQERERGLERGRDEAARVGRVEATSVEVEARRRNEREARQARRREAELHAQEQQRLQAEAAARARDEEQHRLEAEELEQRQRAERAAAAEAEEAHRHEAARAEQAAAEALREAQAREAAELAARQAALAEAEAQARAAEEERAERQAEEEQRVRAEAEAHAAEEERIRAEAARVEAEQRAEAEAVRREAEVARAEAERRAQAERHAAEVEAAKAAAEKQSAEDAAREARGAEARRLERAREQAEQEAAEATRVEAERLASERARLEAERGDRATAADEQWRQEDTVRFDPPRPVTQAPPPIPRPATTPAVGAVEGAAESRPTLDLDSVPTLEKEVPDLVAVSGIEPRGPEGARPPSAGQLVFDDRDIQAAAALLTGGAEPSPVASRPAEVESPTLDGESPGAAAHAAAPPMLPVIPPAEVWTTRQAHLTSGTPAAGTPGRRADTRPEFFAPPAADPRPETSEREPAASARVPTSVGPRPASEEKPVINISELELETGEFVAGDEADAAHAEAAQQDDTDLVAERVLEEKRRIAAVEVEAALARARALQHAEVVRRGTTPVPQEAPPASPPQPPSRSTPRGSWDAEQEAMLRARLSAQRKLDAAQTEAYRRARREEERRSGGFPRVPPPLPRPPSASVAQKKPVEVTTAPGVPAAQKDPTEIGRSLRPPTAPPAQAGAVDPVQAEIQRKFDEQARAWLAEEQGERPPETPAAPESLADSLQTHLEAGLNSDLESLLARSLVRPDSSAQRAVERSDQLEYRFESISHAAGDDADAEDVESLWDDGDTMATDEDRARKARLRLRGLQNLGEAARRGDSPSPAEPAPPPPAAPPSPARPPSSPTPSARVGTPPGQPAVSVDEGKLSEEIKAKHAALDNEDHFQRLGLARGATADQAKTAYFSLVRKFHPDKLPPSLAKQADQVKEIFGAIREAYDVLSHDKSRLEYLAASQRADKPKEAAKGGSGGGAAGPRTVSPEASIEARKARIQGDIALRKKAFADAEAAYGRAYEIEAAANDLAAQAWVIYLDPARKNDLPKVKELLKKALAADPASDKAHYVSGVIARASNDLDVAERHFQAALKSNPQNTDAALEMRVLSRRKDKEGSAPAAPGKKKGLFGL